MADEWSDLWGYFDSWTGVKDSSHPQSPEGGSGPGNSQLPTAPNRDYLPGFLPHPNSPEAIWASVAEAALERARHRLQALLTRIIGASHWEDLRYWAERLLGSYSFGLGACYGIVKNPVVGISGLLSLEKTFILADIYERLTNKTSWMTPSWSAINPATNLLEVAGSLLARAGVLPMESLREAYERREALKKELENAFRHPAEFLGNLKDKIKAEYVKKWNLFLHLSQQSSLRSQFEAGEIFGDVLMDIVMLILTAISVGGAAAKLASKVPELVKLAETLRTAEAAAGAGDVLEGAEGANAAAGASKAPVPEWKGPTDYSSLKNPRGAGPGKKVTTLQKKKMFELNRQQNGGLLRDDVTGEVLVEPKKSVSGETPPPNEAQVDHVAPRSKGGTNEYDNLQIRSRKNNRDKWDN